MKIVFGVSLVQGEITQRIRNRHPNAVEIPINFSIPEPQDTEAGSFQRFVSRTIFCGMRLKAMLRAIDLNDQTSLKAREVDDVTSQRHLPTKAPT